MKNSLKNPNGKSSQFCLTLTFTLGREGSGSGKKGGTF